MFKMTSIAALAAATMLTSAASAGVTLIGTQAAFSAAGTITQNTNWDAYPTNTFTYPGSPFTVGDETYVAGGENIIGGVAGYNMVRNLFTDNYTAGTTIALAGTYNLFAANAGNFASATGTATFAITTNLGSYSFDIDVNGAANRGSLTFVGFEAGAGEYFTSVNVSGIWSTGVTDVQLGTATAAVPEPASWALMIGGFALAGAALRGRKTATAIRFA